MGRLRPGVIAERAVRSRERLDGLAPRSDQAMRASLRQRERALSAQAQMLASLSYQSVLRRGFALVRDEVGKAVRSAGGLAAGTVLDIELADGRIATEVKGATAGTARLPEPTASRTPPAPRAPERARRPTKPSARQPSLFDD